jgi:hypothetical protein
MKQSGTAGIVGKVKSHIGVHQQGKKAPFVAYPSIAGIGNKGKSVNRLGENWLRQ